MMEAVLSCLGLRDKMSGEHVLRWGQYSAAGDEKAGGLLGDFEKKETKREREKSTFTVLVTGMGAYPKHPGHTNKGHYTENDNTSHLITQLLPSHLPPFSKHNPTALSIQILNPTAAPGSAVRSEYAFIREYCKELWRTHGNAVDLILHLGMADGWEWYSIERRAWKEGTVKRVDVGDGQLTPGPVRYYVLPDDVGQTYLDVPGPCPWKGDEVPMQLAAAPGVDIDRLAGDVTRVLNSGGGIGNGNGHSDEQQMIEAIPHPDGGNYLCGFISYESFAQAFVGGYGAKAMFCHVPGWRDEERLGIGRDFVCSLIGQVVRQLG